MANRYKKNGAQAERPETYTEEHRRRWYEDADYREKWTLRRNRDRDIERPSRRAPPGTRWEGPKHTPDPRDIAKRIARERALQRAAQIVHIAGRMIGPVSRAADWYDSFSPIFDPAIEEIFGDFGIPGYGMSPNPGGVVFEGGVAGSFELKCAAPVSPINTYGVFSGHNNDGSCGLLGQASPGGWMNFTGDTVSLTGTHVNRTWVLSRGYLIAGSVQRRQYATIYWEYGGSGVLNGTTMRRMYNRATPDIFAQPNPNWLRRLPSPPGSVLPTAGPEIGQEDSADLAPPKVAYSFSGGGGPRSPRVVVGAPGPTAPPKPGTKERKTLGAMRTVLRILDAVSEAAEVVDAFYEALPKKTQKKWDCDGSRGLIDNAGQYGIDKADCKLRALWHNWHKVDIEKAVRNVVANQLQDRVIGDLSRIQPKNVGRATEEGQKLVNDLLEAIFEESGLTR